MPRHSLLIELICEELPAKGLADLACALRDALQSALLDAQLMEPGTQAEWFATPRRLAVRLPEVAARQPAVRTRQRGPSLSVAYGADGSPTPALLGFCRRHGIKPAELKTERRDEGEWVVHETMRPGQSIAELLPEMLLRAATNLPLPNRMRWDDTEAAFLRPIRNLVVLHGGRVVGMELFGLQAGRVTCGHRQHAPGPHRIKHADDYAKLLKTEGYVIADFTERKKRISQQLERLARKHKARIVGDDQLLDEVTGLVEWPQALLGEFDKTYLSLPAEVLETTLHKHQKFFPLADIKDKLLPLFLNVSNLRGRLDLVRQGNQRVLGARLADAQFFWDADRKQGLNAFAERLPQLRFHASLGHMQDKAERVEKLSRLLARQLGVNEAQAARTAKLCKADLLSAMVGEFPELQGQIGRHYALAQGEKKEIATAIAEHYQPGFAKDYLPTSKPGTCLALADRLDTLAGIFAVGEAPSGERDPYALRRAALGVLRIMIEQRLDLDLSKLIKQALALYPEHANAAHHDELFDFLLARLPGYYRGVHAASSVTAVLACRPHHPYQLHQRIQALDEFLRKTPELANRLVIANKRSSNILAKNPPPKKPGKDLSKAANSLELAMNACEKTLGKAIASADFRHALAELARLADPLDDFFEALMVLDEDPNKRAKRLQLLARLQSLFEQVADFSKIPRS